jgi:DnaK suppressor protein
MARENAYLTDQQIESIRTILLREKEKLIMKENDKEAFHMDKEELSDVLDEASVNIETAKLLRFRNREIFYLKKINKSLERIEKGTYGLCDDCNAEISFDRLLARPTADLCIGCKEETELSERHNYFENRSKSLGHTMAELAGQF